MKKILFHIQTIHRGGAERVIVNLANRFAEAGYECVLVNSFRDGEEYRCSEKVKRIVLFGSHLSGALLRNLKLTRALRNVLKEEKPDCAISFMAEPNFRLLLAARGLPVKTVVSVRNDPNREYAGILYRIFAKYLYPRADGIVFQTEDAKNWFPEKIREKSTVIFNQADEKFYRNAFDGERKNIVAVGRLSGQKNHALLIRAFAKIAGQTDDDLVIYGEGKLRAELEALIGELGMQNRVFLPGVVQDVPGAIGAAKLFVLPSDYEGMPNALMEAMALGLPCIATDCPCGGPRALFGAELRDCLVPVGDVDITAERMIALLKDEETLDRIGRLAQEKAAAFRPEIIFSEWEKFITSRRE